MDSHIVIINAEEPTEDGRILSDEDKDGGIPDVLKSHGKGRIIPGHESSLFNASNVSDHVPEINNSSSSKETEIKDLNSTHDKVKVSMTNLPNSLSVMEKDISCQPSSSLQSHIDSYQGPITIEPGNGANSNFLVYVDNSSGSPVISQVVPETLLHSSSQQKQMGSVVSSRPSYYSGNTLETEKISMSVTESEKPLTVVFDPSVTVPHQEPQRIYIDSSSLVDINQSFVYGPEKDNDQSLRQVLVTTHAVQDSTPDLDERNFHSILVTTEELNGDQSNTNEVSFLPAGSVHWENNAKVIVQECELGVDTEAKDKQLEGLKEQQRLLDLRNLEQSHLAHQSQLIQQRNKKDILIRRSSLEDHLKGFGIDDTTPIFSSVTAKLNPHIVAHLPGCQQFLLKEGCVKSEVAMGVSKMDSELCFQGTISDLVSLHNSVKSLMHLKSQTNFAMQTIGKEIDKTQDKSIFCNLLVPYVSSKGRLSKQSMKAKQAEDLSSLDDELKNIEDMDTDVGCRSPKRTVRKRQRPHLLREKRHGLKGPIKSFGHKSRSSQLSFAENSLMDDLQKSSVASTVQEEVAGEEMMQSVDPDLKDPLQMRLRQEQIKYKEILENTNRLRQLKSALIESSQRTEFDQGLADDVSEKTAQPPNDDSPKKKRGRPPKKHLNENRERVNPRNPLTESEATKQQRLYEENVSFKFFCDLCSFKSKRQSHYDAHVKCHKKHPDVSHKCSLCEFVSLSLPALRRHELKHKKAILRCEVCAAYKTDKKYLMQRHIRIKHSCFETNQPEAKAKFKCDQCSATFHSSKILSRHRSRHIQEVIDDATADDTKNKCPFCSKEFCQSMHLRRHVRDVHGPELRPYLCDKCGKSFKRTDALQQHRLVHVARNARKLPHKCEECNKGFRSQAHLKEHMSMHSTERPFLCHYCGAAFKTQPVQKKHILTLHIRPRTHVCSVCFRQFNTKNALLKHENTHKPAEEKTMSSEDKDPNQGTQEIEVIRVDLSKDAAASIAQDPAFIDKTGQTFYYLTQ